MSSGILLRFATGEKDIRRRIEARINVSDESHCAFRAGTDLQSWEVAQYYEYW